ncbi:hypothetical protein RFI_31647 [Reticulomyxa filosa]|uniref:Uncharacterized protein n=1 Tax=Reticulomyxa filosa TaxID=46433 RepID=X6LX87_RETFI|nr:hypothetical protein RFI_31647 [Reticulomyxa filosa]|eukprot:ETO05752.1 hypothetical protein RFI_31647 [Reticulomyxa filosa]
MQTIVEGFITNLSQMSEQDRSHKVAFDLFCSGTFIQEKDNNDAPLKEEGQRGKKKKKNILLFALNNREMCVEKKEIVDCLKEKIVSHPEYRNRLSSDANGIERLDWAFVCNIASNASTSTQSGAENNISAIHPIQTNDNDSSNDNSTSKQVSRKQEIQKIQIDLCLFVCMFICIDGMKKARGSMQLEITSEQFDLENQRKEHEKDRRARESFDVPDEMKEFYASNSAPTHESRGTRVDIEASLILTNDNLIDESPLSHAPNADVVSTIVEPTTVAPTSFSSSAPDTVQPQSHSTATDEVLPAHEHQQLMQEWKETTSRLEEIYCNYLILKFFFFFF